LVPDLGFHVLFRFVLLLLQSVQEKVEEETVVAELMHIFFFESQQQRFTISKMRAVTHMAEWEQHFCSDVEQDPRTRGRAYYANKATNETRWLEPEEYHSFQLQLDVDLFGRDVSREEILDVLKPLRYLTRGESARECKEWIDARDVLYKIFKNISEHPNEGKYRRLTKKVGGSFVEKVWSKRFARECVLACGFTESADAVELILDTERPEMNAKMLAKCRVLLQRIESAIRARDAHVRAAKESEDGDSGVNQRHLAPNKKCSHCKSEIESGARRLWTTDPLAPRGQYSFKCSQCATNYILCETCWDKKVNGEQIHREHSSFEHLPPIETRHNTSTRGFGRGPWGNFAASSIGNARERLRQRTGL
jgi:hypothetical protein